VVVPYDAELSDPDDTVSWEDLLPRRDRWSSNKSSSAVRFRFCTPREPPVGPSRSCTATAGSCSNTASRSVCNSTSDPETDASGSRQRVG
jgi:hypothetical protein